MTTEGTRGPLDGILVVDLTRILAGPYCTMLLSELGARVIKIERPETGDDVRFVGPFIDGESGYFMSINRGKESMALDMKAPDDRRIFEELLARADVLVENFRPGTMEKLGYDWATLHARWPTLIYAAVSGFGHTGPYRARPAYDMVVQAMGGIMSLTGYPGGPPTRVGTSIGDIAAGMFATIGINAALYKRKTTGEGVFIDVAMLDSQIALLENALARVHATGEVPGPLGSRHPSIAPFQAFQTKDGHIVIAAGNDTLFDELAAALGLPELSKDERFSTNPMRIENMDALQGAMEAKLKTRASADWLKRLQEKSIACGPINNVAQAAEDAQVKARNMIITAGGVPMAGNPVKMTGLDDSPTRPAAPGLDADRTRILSDLGIKE